MNDLPPFEILKKCILEARELTDMGVTLKKKAGVKAEVEVPALLFNTLKNNGQALQVFENESPPFRKEYCLRIADAKTINTAIKMAEQTVAWISEGKGRNWNYERK